MITNEEYLAISRELEQHHALFYMVWEMGSPIFDKSIPTACVRFDKAGERIGFMFNPDFWASLDHYSRCFVIAHECLHVILKHGLRIRDSKNRELSNVALDIVVNHSLVRSFGFQRAKVKDADKIIWTDTVFPGKAVPDDQAFEYYFNQLEKAAESGKGDGKGKGAKGDGTGSPQRIDEHDSLGESDWDDVIDKLNKQLTPTEKDTIKGFVEKHFQDEDKETKAHKPGTESGGQWVFANPGIVKKKRKWETIIKQWSKKYDKPADKDVEQWVRLNRRYVMLDSGLMLPTEMEVEHEVEGKIDLYFFLDTSGSCAHLADRFFRAAASLPTKRFQVLLRTFDTRVYVTSLESRKLYGFGGTAFDILERHIQQEMKAEGKKYPQAVFVATDGYGDTVRPLMPKRWHWFLTAGGSTSCFPKECNRYQLKDYE